MTTRYLRLTKQILDQARYRPDILITELLQEKKENDLKILEKLLDKEILTEKQILDKLIFNWGKNIPGITDKPLPLTKKKIEIQYEGLRDGDQIALPNTKRLSSNLIGSLQILRNLNSVGVTIANLGLPIAGKIEQNKIINIIDYLFKKNIPIAPAVSGRTHPDDILAIKEITKFIKAKYNIRLIVYLFVGSSRIRMLAQGQDKWNLKSIGDWTSQSIESLKKDKNISNIIIPFEDTFGSFPQDIDYLFKLAFKAGANGICICDTCSRGINPQWTINIIRYIGHTIAANYKNKIWELHTHNMLNDAVNNAILAINEGLISVVHGTLGGVGDLGGNMAIENFLLHALYHGMIDKNNINLKILGKTINQEFIIRNLNPLANPFSGGIYAEASRYIPAGVHASAFRRLGHVGKHLNNIFELVYYPISPSSLGLPIRLDIVTPISGKANVLAMAKRLNIANLTKEQINFILQTAKVKGEPLSDREFINSLKPA